MNNIYDIILNFHPELYSFYEWTKEDNIINIDKIPFFKLTELDYINFRNNKVTVTKEFLSQIKEQTKLHSNQKIEYACLITNGKETIAVKFNQSGLITQKSSLYYDEEEETLDEALDMETIKITYQSEIKPINFIPRDIQDKTNYLKKFIRDQTNYLTLKYIAYDYWEKELDEPENIKHKLLQELQGIWTTKKDKLYQIVKQLDKVKT